MKTKLVFPIGYKHYYLEVISEPFHKIHLNKRGDGKLRIYYRCKCICGNEKDIWASALANTKSITKSCGCKRKELTSDTQFKSNGRTRRDWWLEKKYGITVDDYEKLW